MKKNALVLIPILMVLSFTGKTQHHKIDSLNAALINATFAEQFYIYGHLAFEHLTVSKENALQSINQAIALPCLNDSLMAKAYRIKSVIYSDHNDFDSALFYANAGLTLATKSNAVMEQARCLNSIGSIQTMLGEYLSASASLFRSLTIKRYSFARPRDCSTTLNNIGLLYYKLRHYEKAEKYFLESLAEKSDICIQNNLALCKIFNGDPERGLNILSESARFREAYAPMDLMNEAFAYGVGYYFSGKYAEAIAQLKACQVLARNQNNPRIVAECYHFIAMSLRNQDQLRPAIEAITTCLNIAQKSGFKDIIVRAYESLELVYSDIGDLVGLTKTRANLIEQRAQLYSHDLRVKLALESAHVAERELLEIARQQNELMLVKNLASEQANIIRGLGISLVLCFILLVSFLIWLARIKQRYTHNISHRLDQRLALIDQRTSMTDSIVQQKSGLVSKFERLSTNALRITTDKSS